MKNLLNKITFVCAILFCAYSNISQAQCDPGQTYDTYCYAPGESNNVAFEFCPTSGSIAQTTITAGSVGSTLPLNNLTVYEGISGSGTGGTIVLGPLNGDFTGTVITASAPDLCLIFVINSGTVSVACSNGFDTPLETCSESLPASTVTFTAPADLCINAGVQTGLGGGSPTGGVYTGAGVTDDGNGMTYSFDPAAAGAAVHTLTYTQGGNAASDDIEVVSLPTATFTALADLCIDAGIQMSLSGGSPAGGIYSGPGVTDNGDGTYNFNPAIAGLGMHSITYIEPGPCSATASDDVEVLAACGCPVGQTNFFYCGTGIQADLVVFEVCPSAGMAAQADITAGTFTVGGNTLTVYEGATGSGTGGAIVFGPATGDLSATTITGSGADNCLSFVVNSPSGFACQDGFETPLVVCGTDVSASVNFTAPTDLCINSGLQAGLSGGLPVGGVYSGAGVTDDGNGMTYSFDPAAAGVGVHTLTYTEGGNSGTDDVEVIAIPTVSFAAPADVCLDAGIQTTLGGGMPVGGVYSGTGVTDNGDGLTYSFDPLAAGLGVHIITYTEGICLENTTDDIEVIAACSCPSGEVTYFNCYGDNETNLVIFEVCPTAGMFAQADINQGNYFGGDFLTVYQGASGSGTGGTIVFGPSTGDMSGNTILSTVADDCLIFVNNSNGAIGCADGFATPLIVCGISNASNVTFTALPDLSVNAGVQTGLSMGAPSGGVYSGPGVTDDGNGMTYTFDPAAAGVGIHTLTYTTASGSASDDVEVFNLLPPSFSKSFNPTIIGPDAVSTLTFTINNSASGTPVSNINFTDNLPAGMTVASSPNVNQNCFSGTVTAVPGGTTITFANGELTGNGTCTISVNVTTSTAGTSTNTTGDLTSSAGNSGTASANLTVQAQCPIFTKTFSPSTVDLGQKSTLTFTIDNTAGATDLIGATFMDNLPAGMTIASPANVSTSCGGLTVTAVPGTSLISVTSNFTTTVAAGASCTITVDVVAEQSGELNNITENFSIRNTSFQLFNCGLAAATLNVTSPPELYIQKSFVTNPVSPGSTTDLVFTITNFDRDFPATNISFTDDLTSVLAGLTAIGTPLNDVCGIGSQLSGITMLTFTGGTLPPDGSCTVTVPLQIPVSAIPGAYTNTTSAITADVNGTTITGNMATDVLNVADVPLFTKTFLNDPIPAGGTTTLEFTITNTSSTDALTDITFTDNLSGFLSGTTISALPAAGSCGAGSIFFNTTVGAGDIAFQMNDGNIAANSSCTFSVDLLTPTGQAAGTFTNTTSELSGIINGLPVSASPASDDLQILGVPQLSKSFTDDPVNAGDIVNLEFTITYGADASGDATSIAFTDDLNAVIPGLAAVGLPLNDVCGTGATISGTTNLTFSGGTLSPGSSCTFSVPVQVPAGTSPGSYTNVTSALTAMVGGQSATGNMASDNLTIGGLNFSKEFIGDPAIPGEVVTLRFTIENTTSSDATNVVFTDNLSTVLPGLMAQAPLPASPCGGTFAASGNTFLILTGATVNAGTTCTFDVPVLVPASATTGNYTNITSNMTATFNGATIVLDPAVDDLEVNNNLLAISKVFTDDPVLPGGTVNVEYTLTNLDAVNTINNIAFTTDFDDLLTGLAATGLPMSNVCGVGSQISGTGLVSFTGGALAPGASCTFSIPLQVPATAPFGASLPCATSTVTGDVGGLAVVGDPASDNLNIQALEFTKSISGPAAPGETVTITFSITNNDVTNTLTDIAFTDDLDAFIAGMIPASVPPAGSCGPISEVNILGGSTISFGRGELAPGASCSFDVTAVVPCGTASNTYTNTTSAITALGLTGGTATADLTVNTVAVSFTAPPDFCLDAGTQLGMGQTTTPTGGTFSGPGVTDDGNGTSFTFDPAAAGVGTHILTYTFVDANGCSNVGTDDIEIFAVPTVAFTAPADICITSGVQTGLGGGTPTGGIYSGPGVVDDGNGMTYSFDPAVAGLGTKTITYEITSADGCMVSASDDLNVTAPIPVTLTIPSAQDTLCIDAGPTVIINSGSPAGGVYSGPGVTDDGNGTSFTFDPAVAAAGLHLITYTVSGSACSGMFTDFIHVFDLPIVTFSIPAAQESFCVDATPEVIGGGLPVGGIYSGPGVTDDGNGTSFTFDQAAAGVGTHTLAYTFVDANGCSNVGTDAIEIFALPTVAFTAPADLCLNAGVQAGLGGGTPPQGTASGDMGVYSGSGVTDDGNGMTYSFDPAMAGVGTHTLTYTYTDENACSNAASDMIQVFAVPAVSFTAPADLCIDAAVQLGLGGGAPTGGVYAGPGVTDDGNGMTYSFDPAAAGVGTHAITYTVGVAGCTDSASDDVAIFALPTAPTLSITTNNILCLDAATMLYSFTGSPNGGVYSGPGVINIGDGFNFIFNAATAGVGTHTITYTVTNANGCSAAATDDIQVLALPVVTFTAPADLCLNDGVQNNLGGGSPTGGVYSGAGVTDDGNGMTYDFDPASAGVGTHTLTYTFTDGNGCTNSASDDVEVFPLPVVTFLAPADLCVDAGAQSGLGGGTPMGGVYSGTGVIDDGNGMTYSFEPGTAGVGVHAITYTVGVAGCSGSAMDDIEVFALPTVTLSIPAAESEYCVDAPTVAISLAASPTGLGVYSGPGLTDLGNSGISFSFNPSIAGVGVHTVTYTFTDANGCMNSATDMITVNALPIVGFTAPADLCLNAGVQAGLGGGTPPQGTASGDLGVYSGSGVTDDGNGMTYSFDPAAAGVGTHTLTYTYTDENGCSASASDMLEVFALPVVTFAAPADLCINAGVQNGLGGGMPNGLGGVYSGPGVTDDGNGMTYSFDPATAGVGTHTLTYTFVDTNGCSNTATDDIEIFALPVVALLITTNNALCLDAPVTPYSFTGSPNGGVYSGAGVTNLGDGFNFIFNPAVAGVGTHTVTYTVENSNGCSNSATDEITVNPLPIVAFTAPADLCLNAGVQAGLGGGTPSEGTTQGDMGVYSGTGVTDDGNGMTYSFDPAVAGVGTHTLTYTYSDGNGCTKSASDLIEIFALPVVTFTAPAPDVCIEDLVVTGLGGGMPTGGVYAGTGVTDDGDGITFSFDPTAAAPAGGNIPVTYTFIDANGCSGSATDDIFVDPICCIPPGAPIIADLNVCDGESTELIPMSAAGGGGIITAYFEGFDEEFAGIAGNCPDMDPANCATFNPPSNGQWSVTGDPTGLTATSDFFNVFMGVLNAQDTDTEVCFLSSPIDISGLTMTTLSVDLVERGNHEASDYVDVTFIVDGMPTLITDWMGLGDANHTVIDDFMMTTVTASGFTGTTLQIQICAMNNSGAEDIDIDNVSVTGTSVTAPMFKFYDADPALGGATLLAGPTTMYDPGTTTGTSPETVWVTECTECEGVATEVTVTVNTLPVANLVGTDIDCVNGADGAIDLTVVGNGGYTYSWMTNDGSGLVPADEDQTGLTAGTYDVVVTDMNGCMTMGSIEIIDGINDAPPTISCPAAVTIECGDSTDPADTGMPMAMDDCDPNPLVTHMDGFVPGCNPNVGVITRTFMVMDAAGGSAMCEQTITIEDNVNPNFTVPAAVTISCVDDPDDLTITGDVTDAADDCEGLTGGNDIWINEIHYDNLSTDVGEFIEIAGTAGTDLSNYDIYFYNGSNNMVYFNFTMAGIIPNESNGIGAVFFLINGLQNGSPDGIAIVQGMQVVQFISYEGVITAADGPAIGMTSMDIGVGEGGTTPVGESVELTGTGNTYTDFTWTGPNAESPGLLNTNQVIPVAPPAPAIMVTYSDVENLTGCGGTGTITRTWTATDACGNDSMQVQVITVEDNIPPVALCQGITVQLDENGLATITAEDIDGGSSDACGEVTFAASQLIFTCADLDLNNPNGCSNAVPVTLTVTDECGNMATCVAMVTVEDNIAPILTCPADQTINLGPGDCGAYVNYIPPFATDNCELIMTTTFVSTTFIDNNGAAGNMFNVENITSDPITINSFDVHLETAAGTNHSLGAWYVTGGGTYVGNETNAGAWTQLGDVPVVSAGPGNPSPMALGGLTIQPGELFGIYIHQTDGGSNIDYTNGANTYNDGNIELTTGAGRANPVFTGGLFTPRTWNGNLHYSVSAGAAVTVTQISGPTEFMTGDFHPIGEYHYEWQAEDGCGNISTCEYSFFILENETEGSQMNCQPANISVDLACEATIDASLILSGIDIGCFDDYIVEVFYDEALTQPAPNPVGAAEVGQTLYVKITDPDNGNMCWTTVLIEDKIAPELFCTDIEVACFDDIPETLIPLNADGTATLNFPLTTGAGGQIGPDAGAVLNATIDVNIPAGATIADMNVCVDVEHTWMADVRIELNSPAGTNVLIFDVTGCSGDFPIHGCFDDEAEALVDCFDLDMMGAGINLNAAFAGFSDMMSEVDGEDPAGTWTIQITDQANGDQGILEGMSLELNLNLPAGVNEDACGIDDLSFVDAEVDGGTCGNTVITRTWTATDESGNTGTCEQIITVTPAELADVITPSNYDGLDLPTLNCEDAEDKNLSSAFCGAPLGWAMIAAGDFNFVPAPTPGHPSPADEYYPCGLVKYSGTGFPGGGTNCSNLNYTFEDLRINVCSSGLSNGCYKILRQWTILDWCTGESLEYNQTIKIEDNQGPTLTDVEDVVVSTDVWTCTATFYVPEPWIEDNCSDLLGGYSVSASAGNVAWVASLGRYVITDLPLGVHSYTVSAADCCGNETALTFDLDVQDLVPPVAVADLNHAVSLTIDGTAKVFSETFDEGSHDACGPVYLKVIRVPDLLNTANGSFSNQSSTNADALNGDDDIFKFGNQIYFDDHVKFECEDIGDTGLQVQLRVFDVDPGTGPVDPNRMKGPNGDLYGHYNDSWSNIIVEDKLPPYIVAPSNVTVSCEYWFDMGSLDDLSNTTFGTVISTDQNGDGLVNNLDRGYISTTDRVCEGHPLYNPNNPTATYQLDWGIDGLAGDNCSVDVTVNVVDNLVCGQGNITRVFTAIDPDGRTATALQTISIVDCDPYYINDTNCFNFDPFDGVRWPCDVNTTTCGPSTDPAQTGEPQIFNDDNCALISVTYDDEEFPVVPDACFKIKRIWTISDWCQFDQFDSDNNDVYDATDDGVIAGQWEYVQYIKVYNSTAPEFANCDDISICGYNLDCTGSAALTQTVEDDCSPGDLLIVDFKIDADNDGTFDFIGSNQAVYPYPNPNGLPILPAGYSANGDGTYDLTIGSVDYPVGTHRILWSAEDVCSNVGTCEYLFTIEDCKLPTPKAKNGLAVAVPDIPLYVELPAEWFNENSYDNCGIAQLLVASPSGGPGQTTPPANAGPTVIFDCAQVGTQTVDLWVQDVNGNWDYVSTYVVIQPNISCQNQDMASIDGVVESELADPAEDVMIMVDGDVPGIDLDMFTNQIGEYGFPGLPMGYNYVVHPENDNDIREGLSTLDLVLISRHLIGLQPLNSPYKLIAADVDKDQQVSPFDLISLQKVILFIDDEFPNDNTSFRFVDAAFNFPDVTNPFSTVFPEEYTVNGLTQNEVANFVAIKVGDVNNSAQMNSSAPVFDRSYTGDLFFNAADKALDADETATVEFTANDFRNLLGYQFTMDIDRSLEVVDVAAGSTAVVFGTSLLNEGKLTASWGSNGINAVSFNDGEVLFSMTLKANKAGQLSELMSISNSERYTRAEAYTSEMNHMDISLQFTNEDGALVQATDFALLQNQPNPFKDETEISFVLPEAGTATLTIYDVSGRVLKVIEGDYAKGYNKETVKRGELNASGVLYYQLDALTPSLKGEKFTATKKMIVIE